MKPPVVIGIGNSLRSDDGVGCRAARILEASVQPETAQVAECQQLMPELAASIEGAPLVVFLDAAVNDPPGRVRSRRLQPENPGAWSHILSPAQLLALARQINGTAPPAFLVTGGVQTIGFGDRLSPQGEHCAQRMSARARALLLANWNSAAAARVPR